MKKLVVLGATLTAALAVTSAMAEDNVLSTNTGQSSSSVQGAPMELKDTQMDRVTGGDAPPPPNANVTPPPPGQIPGNNPPPGQVGG